MLGQYVRRPKELPAISVSSTKVADAIKKHWADDAWGTEVTLAKKSTIWEEWWINASSITKACPRMFALMAAVGEGGYKKERFNAETLWNFGVGKAYHKLFQSEILASFPPGVLLGRWKSRHFGFTRFQNEVPVGVSLERGWGPRPESDSRGDNWEYDESKLRIPDYRMVVKLDAILDWPDEDGLEVVEIKTEKSEAKDALNPMLGGRPRTSHIEQVHVGMWATGIDRARIIYVFKGEKSLSTSTIEHVVRRDEEIVDEIKARAVACVDAVRSIEIVRDYQLSGLGLGALRAWDDMSSEDQLKVRAKMKSLAEDMARCPECQMKSKGRPKYCNGRDLCFGVRKKKAKK